MQDLVSELEERRGRNAAHYRQMVLDVAAGKSVPVEHAERLLYALAKSREDLRGDLALARQRIEWRELAAAGGLSAAQARHELISTCPLPELVAEHEAISRRLRAAIATTEEVRQAEIRERGFGPSPEVLPHPAVAAAAAIAKAIERERDEVLKKMLEA